MKDTNEPIGTPNAEYVDGRNGAPHCSKCIHYHRIKVTGTCDHPKIAKDADLGKIPTWAGKPRVDQFGCCRFFRDKK